MTNYRLWSQLCTCSRRAIRRKTKRFGQPYHYRPHGTLLARLAQENNITLEQAYRELMELRAFFLTLDP